MAPHKQIKANKKNSKNVGVKTAKGKAVSKYNALKHDLLAKEIIIDTGDGKDFRIRKLTYPIKDVVRQ